MVGMADAPATADVLARAKRVKLVLTDCDGVLTDAGVYVSAQGEQLKRFSLRDGMGTCDRCPWVETHGYPQSSLRDGAAESPGAPASSHRTGSA